MQREPYKESKVGGQMLKEEVILRRSPLKRSDTVSKAVQRKSGFSTFHGKYKVNKKGGNNWRRGNGWSK